MWDKKTLGGGKTRYFSLASHKKISLVNWNSLGHKNCRLISPIRTERPFSNLCSSRLPPPLEVLYLLSTLSGSLPLSFFTTSYSTHIQLFQRLSFFYPSLPFSLSPSLSFPVPLFLTPPDEISSEKGCDKWTLNCEHLEMGSFPFPISDLNASITQ